MKSLFENVIISKFNHTGICELDIIKTIGLWDSECQISQWHNEYRFIGLGVKLCISKQQAKKLIIELNLNCLQSPIFNNAKTWRTENVHK